MIIKFDVAGSNAGKHYAANPKIMTIRLNLAGTDLSSRPLGSCPII